MVVKPYQEHYVARLSEPELQMLLSALSNYKVWTLVHGASTTEKIRVSNCIQALHEAFIQTKKEEKDVH